MKIILSQGTTIIKQLEIVSVNIIETFIKSFGVRFCLSDLRKKGKRGIPVVEGCQIIFRTTGTPRASERRWPCGYSGGIIVP